MSRVRRIAPALLCAVFFLGAVLVVPGHGAVAASGVSGQPPGTFVSACPPPTTRIASCQALVKHDTATPSGAADAGPAGWGPADLRSAYALTATGRAAQTLAIIDAYDDPTAEADLAVYRAKYGLPPCTTANGCFRKVGQDGGGTDLVEPRASWALEIAVDLDMVSAICPGCRIVLVEARSADIADLGAGVNEAVAMGAKFVSTSWGSLEVADDIAWEAAYFNHPGVAITAGSGDTGSSPLFPATSRYVTSVGGTVAARADNARGWSETTWSASNAGCSAYIPKPAFQIGLATGCSGRAVGDVAAVADGVAIYQTYGLGGWSIAAGTSVASPIIASLYALAGDPPAADYPNTYPYRHAANLNDVTTGQNGTCGPPLCAAGPGWDGPTGLGTPNGAAAFRSGATDVAVVNPGDRTATAGVAMTPLALWASGGTGTYAWSASGLPKGVTIDPISGSVSGTPNRAGTYSVKVTATSGKASGSARFGLTVPQG